jgi:hypothetical protein
MDIQDDGINIRESVKIYFISKLILHCCGDYRVFGAVIDRQAVAMPSYADDSILLSSRSRIDDNFAFAVNTGEKCVKIWYRKKGYSEDSFLLIPAKTILKIVVEKKFVRE